MKDNILISADIDFTPDGYILEIKGSHIPEKYQELFNSAIKCNDKVCLIIQEIFKEVR